MSGQWKHAFEVKWRIENLESWLNRRDDSLYSPQFLAKTLTNTHWKLRLSRKFHLAENYISLALERDVDDDQPELIALNYELSILASDQTTIKSISRTAKFAPKTVSQELNVKGVAVLVEKKETYLPEGVLTVCCKLWKAWSTISKGGQCSLRSVIGRKFLTLNGNIDYFSNLPTGNFVSVNFISPSSDISFLTFDVCRQGNGTISFQRTDVECKCISSYSCQLFVLRTDGQRAKSICTEPLKTLLESHKSCTFEIYYDYLNRPNYLKNDTLTFQIEIIYNPGVESEYIDYDCYNYKELTAGTADLHNTSTSVSEDAQSSPLLSLDLSEEITFDVEKNKSSDEDKCFGFAEKNNLPSTTLKEDLASLYNDHLFCDTKLQTDTETFPAHRSVLSARSPVFKKMFMTDMKEKAGECINIPDISSDTVRRMLQFLYTDLTGDLDMQSAKDLYIASDKYDIASLKQRCSSFIVENLCPANVCEVIVLADMHQDKFLVSAAHEFALTYDKEVFGSDEWKSFMKNFSSLAAHVMYLKCMKE